MILHVLVETRSPKMPDSNFQTRVGSSLPTHKSNIRADENVEPVKDGTLVS